MPTFLAYDSTSFLLTSTGLRFLIAEDAPPRELSATVKTVLSLTGTVTALNPELFVFMNTFLLGNSLRINLTIREYDGTEASPLDLKLKVKRRDTSSVEAEVPLVMLSGGVAYGDYYPTEVGFFDWRAYSEVDPRVAYEGSFEMTASLLDVLSR